MKFSWSQSLTDLSGGIEHQQCSYECVGDVLVLHLSCVLQRERIAFGIVLLVPDFSDL